MKTWILGKEYDTSKKEDHVALMDLIDDKITKQASGDLGLITYALLSLIPEPTE